MFYSNKYTRWYYHIITSAKSQSRKKLQKDDPAYIYYEAHHIIPKSMGGTETVLLTAKEHFIAHVLLVKMCVSLKHQFQMIKAFDRLRCKNPSQGQRYFNSRLYEQIKSHIVVPEEVRAKQRDRVSCLNTETGNYENVSKPLFDVSPHLVGINAGKRGQKRAPEFGAARTGSQNTFFGKTHSEETKRIAGAKVSAKLKGKPKSEEHKRKLKEAWARRKLIALESKSDSR